MAYATANFPSGSEPACPMIAIEQSYDSASELGTAAIAIDHTRFDNRWNRVRRAAPGRLMRIELQMAGARRGLAETEILERVNRWVNHRVTYVTDDRNYGQGDVWATASETIARGSGDCEDFAILKMQMLRAAGIGDDRVKLVLLRDLALGADHALLLVRTETGWVALDNMTDRVYDGSRPIAVRPIMSFSGERSFVHGYLDPPPAQRFTRIATDSRPLAPAATNDMTARAARIAYKATRYDGDQENLLASGAIFALISWPLGSGV
ncbi:transglutaminase-like cysteine peptidase [Sphingopyxis sp.]|uniref:transglutaminase-like cysteine peptidase n=1 Tax=Sphingopyxis sp. TaxID=1908224 RepID=UPI003BA8E5C5